MTPSDAANFAASGRLGPARTPDADKVDLDVALDVGRTPTRRFAADGSPEALRDSAAPDAAVDPSSAPSDPAGAGSWASGDPGLRSRAEAQAVTHRCSSPQ